MRSRQSIVPVPFYFDVDRLLLGGSGVMLTLPIMKVWINVGDDLRMLRILSIVTQCTCSGFHCAAPVQDPEGERYWKNTLSSAQSVAGGRNFVHGDEVSESLSGRPFSTRCNVFFRVSATGPFFGATRAGRTSLGGSNDPNIVANAFLEKPPVKFFGRFSGIFSSRRFCRVFLEVSSTQGNALQKRRSFFSRYKRKS
jgi:hypothetical protein